MRCTVIQRGSRKRLTPSAMESAVAEASTVAEESITATTLLQSRRSVRLEPDRLHAHLPTRPVALDHRATAARRRRTGAGASRRQAQAAPRRRRDARLDDLPRSD